MVSEQTATTRPHKILLAEQCIMKGIMISLQHNNKTTVNGIIFTPGMIIHDSVMSYVVIPYNKNNPNIKQKIASLNSYDKTSQIQGQPIITTTHYNKYVLADVLNNSNNIQWVRIYNNMIGPYI